MNPFQTIEVRADGNVTRLRIHRPEARNTINDLLIEECHRALDAAERSSTVVILEGSREVFCFGADFAGMRSQAASGGSPGTVQDPSPLYDLWTRLALGPFVSVAHVEGAANAGGVGFAAACDIVIAGPNARFSLSELVFGLLPACVLPFLIRRVGHQRAHYMTLSTAPVAPEQALLWGLVDATATDSEDLLRRHLLRLRRLPRHGVAHYKRYQTHLSHLLTEARPDAIAANREAFADRRNLEGILRYVDTGQFPWES